MSDITFVVEEVDTGKTMLVTLEWVINEINRDRGDSWEEYREHDWLEGWSVWVEGDIYRLYIPLGYPDALTGIVRKNLDKLTE